MKNENQRYRLRYINKHTGIGGAGGWFYNIQIILKAIKGLNLLEPQNSRWVDYLINDHEPKSNNF